MNPGSSPMVRQESLPTPRLAPHPIRRPSTPPPERPLYTPIWDYDRFPVPPKPRDSERHSSLDDPSFSSPRQPSRPQSSHLQGLPSPTSPSCHSSSSSPTHDLAPISQHPALLTFSDTDPSISKYDHYKAQLERIRSLRESSSSSSALARSHSPPASPASPSTETSLSRTHVKKKGFFRRFFKQKQSTLTSTSEPPGPIQPRSVVSARSRSFLLNEKNPPSAFQSPPASPSSSTSSPPTLPASTSLSITPATRQPLRISTQSMGTKGRASLDLSFEANDMGEPSSDQIRPMGHSPDHRDPTTFTTHMAETSARPQWDQDKIEEKDPLSPLERQQDRWQNEWLRPTGAIHSLFRDQPTRFNCPHCGATKVKSQVQYVPGVMSYLIAFGLLFLTLGTLSYLPFRKQHEDTKDCLHWCPQCGHKVARFSRVNDSWHWV